MFSNIGWGEMAILVIAALVILGPERLPSAMQWVAKTLKQVREYATGAQSQLKEDLGPEFDDLKKPFDELRGMRGMTPRGVITKHLFDGDDSIFTGNFDEKPQSQQQPPAQYPPVPYPSPPNPAAQNPAGQNPAAQNPAGLPQGPAPQRLPAPDAPGAAAARFDDEAT